MFLPSFDLKDKVAVVTGGGRGIGRALAIGLAEAGADVAILARTEKDLEEVAVHITNAGRKVYKIQADITNKDAVDQAVEQIVTRAGKIDILINNAGMNIRTPALEVTEEEWQNIVDLNLKSAFFMAQACAKHMKSNNSGKIINISSVAGHVALKTGVVYGATKAGLIQMTKTLSYEWAKYGININAIGPWYFKTPLTEKLLADEKYLQEILDVTPMKRVGELKDLVGAAVFLSSEASNYVTGQTLFVDGGMTVYGF
ncbi:SDR family NAD(P)-dependent oxidoreductase [Pseudalkalibacillus caeni]|uniref:Glucose 1-dehydrogenase n=1 Tax=Exobacillus caeni TaxID=2574798 RepID=A0A5R9FCS5_9BACL|nr:glucose 1-dehydrogenase [Pseudalkalibacillus caeni]TLS37455.1 glucose 1-dehydrogenase [Pseudalkalibacillus caeni]